MKKNIQLSFALIFVLFLGKTYAQSHVMNLQGYNDEPYHFGFILAANQMLFSVQPVDNLSDIMWTREQSPDVAADQLYIYSIEMSPSPGFSVGILGNLRMGRYLDLRVIPTLSFGSRSLIYHVKAYKNGSIITDDQGNDMLSITKHINSTYLVFPMLLKYRSWRANNVGAYFLGGVNYSIDLAAAKKTKNNPNDLSKIYLKTDDIALEAGAGFDFYTNYFKLGIEAKMIYGLNNLIVKNNDMYSGSINHLRSKVFMLSFIFE